MVDLEPLIEAEVYVFKPPAIAGLGTGSGVELELQDRSGNQYERLVTLAPSGMDSRQIEEYLFLCQRCLSSTSPSPSMQ